MKTLKIILLCLICIIIGFFAAMGIDKIYEKLTYKQYRYLIGISSFKRPIFLSGQILRFKNQTYQNFDISVSIKGAPEGYMRQMFFPEWHDLMDKGQLKVRFDKNKDQLSNLMDTLRDVDLSQYDYFCKVDDDDWYAPDYLENVNEWLNKDKNISFTSSTNVLILDEAEKRGIRENTTIIYPYRGDLSGPTMCFSIKTIEMAYKLSKNPAALEPQLKKEYVSMLSHITEDRLLNELAHMTGKTQMRNSGAPKVIYGRQYPSVTRNWGYLK